MIYLELNHRDCLKDLDICKQLNEQMDRDSVFKDIFFGVGVMHQLQNLELYPEKCQIEPLFLQCWWRLFDSKFRPRDINSLRPFFVVQEGLTNDEFDNFVFLYTHYIRPDFFDLLIQKNVRKFV